MRKLILLAFGEQVAEVSHGIKLSVVEAIEKIIARWFFCGDLYGQEF